MNRVFTAMLLFPLVASAADGFQTPSGNIHCAVDPGSIRCDIVERSFTPPPRPRSCQLDWGGSVELTQRAAAMICVSDTAANPDYPRLAYGTAWQGAGITCTSAQTGLRCVNAAGRGFELSRARLSLF